MGRKFYCTIRGTLLAVLIENCGRKKRGAEVRCRKSNAVHDNAIKGARDKNGDEKCTQLRKMLFSLFETKREKKLQCHGNFPKVISKSHRIFPNVYAILYDSTNMAKVIDIVKVPIEISNRFYCCTIDFI